MPPPSSYRHGVGLDAGLAGQQLVDAGYEAIPGSVEKFGSFIAAEDKRLGAIVKSANMKAE